MKYEEQTMVQLVNTEDAPIGIAEKMEAHRQGWLHRAISVIIFNTKGEMLLQRRAKHKYHSSQLWSNACCTHPFPNETNSDAALRRLQEEMGIQCQLKPEFSFIYKAELDNQLTEHEFDHIFTGVTDQVPQINLSEVDDYCYRSYEEIQNDFLQRPDIYTVWFRLIIEKMNRKDVSVVN